jgi:hypothetical protein
MPLNEQLILNGDPRRASATMAQSEDFIVGRRPSVGLLRGRRSRSAAPRSRVTKAKGNVFPMGDTTAQFIISFQSPSFKALSSSLRRLRTDRARKSLPVVQLIFKPSFGPQSVAN